MASSCTESCRRYRFAFADGSSVVVLSVPWMNKAQLVRRWSQLVVQGPKEEVEDGVRGRQFLGVCFRVME